MIDLQPWQAITVHNIINAYRIQSQFIKAILNVLRKIQIGRCRHGLLLVFISDMIIHLWGIMLGPIDEF